MLENTSAPYQPNSTPIVYDPAQEVLQGIQQRLTEQGILVSDEEALQLFRQKLIHTIKREIQQNLAKQGIEVSPDEAVLIDRLHLYHQLMKRIGSTDPLETT